MTGRTRLKLVTLLGALAVVVTGAALAWACTPQAYMTLGPGPNSPTAPRDGDYFMPGEEVTVTGHLFQPTTSVKLQWGLEGALIAEVQTDAEGSWTHTFTPPAETPLGAYVLAAVAPGTPAVAEGSQPVETEAVLVRATLRLGPPPATKAPDQPAAKKAPERRTAKKSPERPKGEPAPQPAVSPPVEPAFEAGNSEPVDAVPPRSAPTDTAQPAAAAQPRRARPTPAPPRGGRLEPPPAAVPPSSPVLAVGKVQDETAAPPWYVVALAALGILFVGGAAGGFVVAGHRPSRPLDGVGAEPGATVAQPDGVEAELQEIIAEQSARTTSEQAPQTGPGIPR